MAKVKSEALTSKDGAFICTPDHAVEVAYLMSRAEVALFKRKIDRSELGYILCDYLEGRIDEKEAMEAINE